MGALKNEEEKIICKAVLRNDEEEIQRILTSVSSTSSAGLGSRRVQEEQKL